MNVLGRIVDNICAADKFDNYKFVESTLTSINAPLPIGTLINTTQIIGYPVEIALKFSNTIKNTSPVNTSLDYNAKATLK